MHRRQWNHQISRGQLGLLLETYIDRPHLSTRELGNMFHISEKLASKYIAKHWFGLVQGEREYVALPSKINEIKKLIE